jgi:hypothetical protein
MTSIKGWIRIVLDVEQDCPRDCGAGNLCDPSEANTMSEATPPAVMTLPSLTTRVFVVRSADRGRQFGKGSGPPIELIGQHHRRSQDQIFSVSLRCYLAT